MATKIKRNNTTYKCLYCNSRYNRVDLIDHINEDHEEMIPENYTATRIVFNYINKRPANYNGKCTECGGPTRWDEDKARYDRQCQKKACKESYLKKFEENMMRTRGVTRISTTEEGQKKMLANRKISGEYTFRNGVKKTYCGSYEKKALEFMDKVMEINPDDILCPGPILEYTYEGKVHIYITDFYYQPYNLIIEVKDGGDNPNTRNMPEYRAKQIAKEQFIIKHTNFNYLRLTNNDLSQLLSVFTQLKMELVENTGERVIHVNESEETSPIVEFMNALNAGQIPGIRDTDAYIVNYKTNNVFSDNDEDNYAIANSPKLDNLIGIVDGKLGKINKEDIKEAKCYKLDISLKELNERFKDMIGKDCNNSILYEIASGDKLYFKNQEEKQFIRVTTLEEYIDRSNKAIYEYFVPTIEESNEIDNVVKSIEEVCHGQF